MDKAATISNPFGAHKKDEGVPIHLQSDSVMRVTVKLIVRMTKINTNTGYRKNSKIWDTSNNCHNCPKNRKV